MKTFNITCKMKVEVWQGTSHNIEANSVEDAIRILKEHAQLNVYRIDLIDGTEKVIEIDADTIVVNEIP